MNSNHQSDNSLLFADNQLHFFNRIVEIIEPVKLGLTVLAASVLMFCTALSVAFF